MGQEDAGETERSVREKTEAPERYETNVTTDRLTLTADAVLTIPDVTEIPVMTLERQPYTKEEYQKIKEIFTDLWGMEWGGEKVELSHGHPVEEQGYGVYDTSGEYYLSFWAGEAEKTSPIIWMNKNHAYAENAENLVPAEEQEEAKRILREKSEDFLKKLGAEDMVLTETRWMEISQNGSTVPGICFWYRRTCRKIPILGSTDTALGASPKSGTQYFRFKYTLSGEPVEVMGISREKYMEQEAGEDFLLPFAAVAEIFEQHCRVFAEDEENSLFNPETQEDGMEELLVPEERRIPCAHIHVTRVVLEYRYEGENYGAGTIFPVWSFYGSAGAAYKKEDGTGRENLRPTDIEKNEKERLLLSIGAGDGVIY